MILDKIVERMREQRIQRKAKEVFSQPKPSKPSKSEILAAKALTKAIILGQRTYQGMQSRRDEGERIVKTRLRQFGKRLLYGTRTEMRYFLRGNVKRRRR